MRNDQQTLSMITWNPIFFFILEVTINLKCWSCNWTNYYTNISRTKNTLPNKYPRDYNCKHVCNFRLSSTCWWYLWVAHHLLLDKQKPINTPSEFLIFSPETVSFCVLYIVIQYNLLVANFTQTKCCWTQLIRRRYLLRIMIELHHWLKPVI